MHRHGYRGRTLVRNKDQRKALLRNLATSLVEQGSIVTTTAKAKELMPFMGRLITKAKKQTLAARRELIRELDTSRAVQKLYEELAKQFEGKTGGFLKIETAGFRKGDRSALSRVSILSTKLKNDKPNLKKTAADNVKPVPNATVKPGSRV